LELRAGQTVSPDAFSGLKASENLCCGEKIFQHQLFHAVVTEALPWIN
jgi:hypothetical protein